MNFFEKILYFLQGTMNRPNPYGWFHLLWVGITIICIFILFKTKNKHSDKQLKLILGIYGIVAFVLELIKQLIWSFNYDPLTNITTWDYQWYSAPFQLCTTPIFISLICLFLKKNEARNSLLSYMAFITILGSFMTIIIPDSCFVETIEVNIHTMWLHCGSLVLSIYLLMTGEVKINKDNLLNSYIVFLIFVIIAQILNVGIYNLGILNGEEFNMFYISPYFISSLPVFNTIQQNVPYVIFIILYIIAIMLGGLIVYYIAKLVKNIYSKKGEKNNEKSKSLFYKRNQ